MSKKKTRPKHGEPIPGNASLRDAAAALGISTTELFEWKKVSELPEDEFEARLASQVKRLGAGTQSSVSARTINRNAPVISRGRVERALSLYRNMTAEERRVFSHRVGLNP
jgi:hypothetical protein